jgi:5-methylcytosine-specific restriction enzyme A
LELTGPSTAEFEEQVVGSKALSPAERARRMLGGDVPPAFYTTTTVVFARSPHVAAEVLERAAGRCERCAKAAPFLRARDGTPYLEVHHRIRLADGGFDTVDNAIALCPNCHRECHHGQADD